MALSFCTLAAVGRALAQNSDGSAGGRVAGRPFAKGHSGNPGGRPKGFVQAIREQTRDGMEMVELMLSVLRGELATVRLRDRIDAATWLADRGFGKPTQASTHPDNEDGKIPLELLRSCLGWDEDERGAALGPGGRKVYDD